MSEQARSQSIEAFESATELRKEHESLLGRLDEILEQDPSISSEASVLARIEPEVGRFLTLGSATGVSCSSESDLEQATMIIVIVRATATMAKSARLNELVT